MACRTELCQSRPFARPFARNHGQRAMMRSYTSCSVSLPPRAAHSGDDNAAVTSAMFESAGLSFGPGGGPAVGAGAGTVEGALVVAVDAGFEEADAAAEVLAPVAGAGLESGTDTDAEVPSALEPDVAFFAEGGAGAIGTSAPLLDGPLPCPPFPLPLPFPPLPGTATGVSASTFASAETSTPAALLAVAAASSRSN